MLIHPESHLFLHRLQQHERDRHRSHVAAIRARRDTAKVVRAATSGDSTTWQRLLASRRSRTPAQAAPC
jgi:hypothetical protein